MIIFGIEVFKLAHIVSWFIREIRMLDNKCRSRRLTTQGWSTLGNFGYSNMINRSKNEKMYLLPRRFRKLVMVLLEFLASCCRSWLLNVLSIVHWSIPYHNQGNLNHHFFALERYCATIFIYNTLRKSFLWTNLFQAHSNSILHLRVVARAASGVFHMMQGCGFEAMYLSARLNWWYMIMDKGVQSVGFWFWVELWAVLGRHQLGGQRERW